MRGCIDARWLRRVLAGWCALALAAGCGDLAPGQQPGISGELIARDDAGLPDRPITGGTIIIVPKRQGMDWFRSAYPKDRLYDLGLANMPFTPGLVRDMGGKIVKTDDDGHFPLDVPPGRYLLCYAHHDNTATAGCHRIDLPQHGSVRATWLYGGFSARVE